MPALRSSRSSAEAEHSGVSALARGAVGGRVMRAVLGRVSGLGGWPGEGSPGRAGDRVAFEARSGGGGGPENALS